MNPLSPISRLDAIGLEELNAQAELQTRVDRKYVVPRAMLASVLADLPTETRVLQLAGERSLRYASQYFDTPNLDSYYGAAQGRRHRFKVRARTYVDSGGSFLEVKTRGGRAATVKNRVPVAGDILDDDAVAYATDLLADAGVPGAPDLAATLTPVLVTRYRRATLLLPASDDHDGHTDPSRGTIDTDLTWIARDGRRLTLPHSAIVETKSGQRAGALDRALWRRGMRPATISKYGTGMAALYPSLPSNKWTRVLKRDFGANPIVRPRPAGPRAAARAVAA
jgi:VTC domain.